MNEVSIVIWGETPMGRVERDLLDHLSTAQICAMCARLLTDAARRSLEDRMAVADCVQHMEHGGQPR